MSRRNFADILNSAGVDIAREYKRLIVLYYHSKHDGLTLDDISKYYFHKCPFKGTCISLNDFDETHGFNFPPDIVSSDIDTLITFCEYSCNMLNYIIKSGSYNAEITQYFSQIQKLIDIIGYEKHEKEGLILFTPKSQAVNMAAQSVDYSTSYKLIEYNHHSLRGDIEAKKNILLLFATQLEPRREELNSLNRSLCSDLFMLFNNLNIRHNNVEEGSASYKEVVAKMSGKELEKWYDDTYMLCIEAFIALDNKTRREEIKQLKDKLY